MFRTTCCAAMPILLAHTHSLACTAVYCCVPQVDQLEEALTRMHMRFLMQRADTVEVGLPDCSHACMHACMHGARSLLTQQHQHTNIALTRLLRGLLIVLRTQALP